VPPPQRRPQHGQNAARCDFGYETWSY